MKKIGKLIAIEGISCSGKTTLMKKLEELMFKEDVIFLGGYDIRNYSSEFTKLSNKLSKDIPYFDLPLIVELHFFISEILYDLENIIKPSLIQGKTIIYDNYWMSIFIIECSIAIMKYDKKEAKKYCKYIMKIKKNIESLIKVVEPYLTIYIDSPIEATVDRMKKRDNKFDDKYIINLQKNISRLYKKYLKDVNVYFVQNDLDIKTYEEKIINIYNYLKEYL